MEKNKSLIKRFVKTISKSISKQGFDRVAAIKNDGRSYLSEPMKGVDKS